jgi:hypothetical protein
MFVVVTVFAIGLGWAMKGIGERREAVENIRRHLGLAAHHAEIGPDGRTRVINLAPFWRRWIGDESWRFIEVPENTSDVEMERLKRLFPEAETLRRRQTLAPQS